jgi:hypothetical protein
MSIVRPWRRLATGLAVTVAAVLVTAAQRFMAQRAHGTTMTVPNASHAVLVSKPAITARLSG